MALPVSLILLAVGAILVWGINADDQNINEDAIGWILMIIGLLGLVLSFLLPDRWGAGYFRRSTYVEGEPVVRRRVVAPPRRTTVVEEEDVPPPPAAGPPY